MYKQAIIKRLNDYANIGLRATYMPQVDMRHSHIDIDGKRNSTTANLSISGLVPKMIAVGNALDAGKPNYDSTIVVSPAISNTWKSRGRQAAAIGSIAGGAALGGTGGYLGSNWLSKKLGLKGGGKENDFLHKRLGIDPNSKYRKYGDIVLRTLGTAGGAALGGYGGAAGYGAVHMTSRGVPYKTYKNWEPNDKKLDEVMKLLNESAEDDDTKEFINSNSAKTMVNSIMRATQDKLLFSGNKLVIKK